MKPETWYVGSNVSLFDQNSFSVNIVMPDGRSFDLLAPRNDFTPEQLHALADRITTVMGGGHGYDCPLCPTCNQPRQGISYCSDSFHLFLKSL